MHPVPPSPPPRRSSDLVPASNADTKPPADTVATLSALDVQVTVRPLKTAPLASRNVAVNCWVPPTVTLAVAGLTVTDATGFGAPAAVVPLTVFDSAPNT